MEFRDYATIFNFLRDPECRDSTGVQGIDLFVSLIQSIEDYGYGKKYIQIAEDLPPIARQFDIHTLPSEQRELQDQISTELSDLKRGRRAEMGRVYVAWLWNYHRASTISLLNALSFDFDRIERDDLIYIPHKRSIDVFLCWSGEYAQEVAKAIRDFFGVYAGRISVFLSSVDIQNGAWESALKASLYGASRGLLLVTQDVLDSPYLEHEFAILSTKADAPTIFRLGAPRAVLSPIIQRYQDQEYSERGLRIWIESVLKPKGLELDQDEFDRLLEEVQAVRSHYAPTYVTADEERWETNLSRPLLMAEQSSSPFDLEQVIAIAKQRLVMIAQNHWFMTDSPHGGTSRFWPLVSDKLRSGVDVEIVAMHEDVEPTVKVVDRVPDAYALWSSYMEAEAFKDHASACWRTLEEWSQLYGSIAEESPSKLGSLRIYGAYFTPITMKMVDPDDRRGIIIVSPRGPLRTSHNRPEFVLRRQHERQAFDYFRLMINEGPINQGWKLMFA